MNYSNLDKLTKSEILSGSFGIERETLRVDKNGELLLTPHPKVFGDKLKNPIVTTDFSESQIEIISPTFDDINETYTTFCLLTEIVNEALPENEYFWYNSLPCILPEADKIPIAHYGDDKEGQKSEEYRMKLAEKYGLKKQMISGIHFNFSFASKTLEKLYSMTSKITFKEFKNEIYLKISRNYLRHCWLIIYLTGCSVGCHESFTQECIDLMDKKDESGSYYSSKGTSFRNASSGYKNLKKLYPNYDSVIEFRNDVLSYIESGDLSEAKELYTQIRLKPKNPKNMLNSLVNDGIEYVEVRTVDINPFNHCGIKRVDMRFLHLFLIYMYIKNESNYEDWQKEAIYNEELCASKAFDNEMRLIKDGCEITLKEWGLEIINDMYRMVDELGIKYHDTLDLMKLRIENPNLTYSHQLYELIEKEGYVNSMINLSIKNKSNIKHDDSDKIKKYKKLALKDQFNFS